MRFLLAALAILAAAAAPAAAEKIAIVHGRVVTLGPAGTVEDGMVVIDKGRITSVSRGVAPPSDARVIDARGKWVTPGIIHPFSHLGLTEVVAFANANDAGARDSAYSAAFDVQYGLDANITWVATARAEGITRAVATPAAGARLFSGYGAVVSMAEDGPILLRARAFQTVELGTLGAGNSGGARGSAWVELLEALRMAADGSAPPDREKALTRADLAAVKPVLTGAVPLLVHVEKASDIRQLLTLRKLYPKLRLILQGASEAWMVASEIAAAEVPVILCPFSNLPWNFETLASTRENAARLEAAGVRIAFSPDVKPDFPMVGEIRQGAGIAVAHGLAWDAALRAITLNPARIFGLDDSVGSIETGKIGDLVIWEGDPLELSSHAGTVLIAGMPVSTDSRQTALRRRYLGR